MAKRVVQEEAFKDFEAKSSHVLAQHAAESIQHMTQAELQRLKSLLGHGEEWTTWSTPREWFPSGSRSSWEVRIKERLVANLPSELRSLMYSTLNDCESKSLLEDLLDQAVLACNRYFVLCRIGPVHLGNGRNSLDPSVIAQNAHQSIPFLAAVGISKAMAGVGEGRKPMPEEEKLRFLPLIFASVSKDDVNAMPLSASTKQVVFAEMKRMHAASTRGLWMDAPPSGVDIKKSTRVSGQAEATQPEILRAPHLPLPDNYLCEIGQRSHWIIEHLGPNILRVLSDFQDLWQEAHDLKLDVRTLSERCAAALKAQVWIDARGQPIDQLPFELKLSQRGAHIKKVPPSKVTLPHEQEQYCVNEKKRTEIWPPRGAAQLFGLAKVLQGAHLFVVGLSTGTRIGELLTMERGAIHHAPNGTAFANGRTFKLVRRHDGQLRDWPLPKFAESAILQQAQLISLLERLSPLSHIRPFVGPSEVPAGTNLWSCWGKRNQPATAQILQALLRDYSAALCLDARPGGQGLRPHRLRKSLARLVALAIVQAPKILQDVFGHEHIEMTIYYILTDVALSEEIDEIVRELRVIRCADDLSSFLLSDDAGTSEIEPPQSGSLSRDGYGGKAAATIRRAVAEHGQQLHQSAKDWGAEDIRDLAEVLTLGGTTWNLVRPGVLCTKALTQFGPCNKKRGHADPANCQTSCDYRLEQAWLRNDVDRCISQALEHWEFETKSGKELIAEYWAGQVRMHLGRFADLEQKWREDPRVQIVCGSERLCEA